jgi:D-alanyl-D-alanine carboxypeptidase/D-alanyl-D-alanine-endopeptidase (penicillin-binding protein 4)
MRGWHQRRWLLAWVILVGLNHLTIVNPGFPSPHSSEIQQKINHLVGPKDSVLVAASNAPPLVSINPDRALVPASILKILTSLAALENLGRSFRFKTEFYIDAQNNLKIKGYGDPLLVSERLQTIGVHLSTLINRVNDIVLDDTYFEQPIRVPGRGTSTEPYDAPNGALCVNFNTVAFAQHGGQWVSAEPQTPLLPSVIPKIRASGLTEGRITLAANSLEALDYTGRLFEHFLKKNGITILGTVKRGQINQGMDRLIWVYRSESDLGEMVSRLLEFSNNFMANQILLILGAKTNGPPATMKKGLATLKDYYHNTLGIPSGKIVEASGISRHNCITARAMLKIVERFSPYYTLMRQSGRQYYKTGHLKGIRTRAGYIATHNGQLYRFVVMLNTPGKSTHRIMQVLEKELK